MDGGEESSSVLWSVVRTSTPQTLFSVLAAAIGSGGTPTGRTFEVDRFADGLIISETSALGVPSATGGAWVAWEDVVAIRRTKVASDKDAPWLVIEMKDGTPVNLGPGHILARPGSAAATVEIEAKTNQLTAEWEAWKRIAHRSIERDDSV